jgi:hypothetical protein
VQAFLHAPGPALVTEIETISTPGMTYEVMDGAKPVKRAAELAVEKGMEALPHGGG